jgi:peptide/nickel transport system permease protein
MATQANILQLSTERDYKETLGLSLFQLALRRLRRDNLTLLAMGILGTLALLALLAPVICNVLNIDPLRTDVERQFLPFGAAGHPLGTDDIGRDHLARLLYGAQVSLGIATIAAIISVVIGVSLGVITGYYGGFVDDLMNWFITTLDSIPALILLIIIIAVFGATPTTIVLILGLLGWTGTTRLVRGETLSLREREFIVGARAIGAAAWQIMFFHIVPNLFSIVVITLALDVGALILTESVLSFLGVGIREPTPSWGNMLTSAQTIFTRGVHLVILPGVLITVTVLCLYVIGDGLRDAFDPTLTERK